MQNPGASYSAATTCTLAAASENLVQLVQPNHRASFRKSDLSGLGS
jgi:hypothetical protein